MDVFRAAVAFVKRSGTKHIAPALAAFARTRAVEIIAGIDHGGTSTEGLQDLLDAVTPTGRVIVFHNRLPFTFHPKVYLFKSSVAADVMVGSGNLTEGGLFTNYEAAARFSLDLAEPRDVALLSSVERTLDAWADLSAGTALVLDNVLLARLTVSGLSPSEADAPAPDGKERDRSDGSAQADQPFAARTEHRAPALPERDTARKGSVAVVPSTVASRLGFVMTLLQTDAGVGQTSTGTSRRSPEIFVPLAARDAHPDFWGWPDSFVEDPEKPGKHDRPGVRIRLMNNVILVHMWYNPDKRDLRLRNEALRSAGRVGDILRIERTRPDAGHDYDAEVIPQGTEQHAVYHTLCRHAVRNSDKRYGYY